LTGTRSLSFFLFPPRLRDNSSTPFRRPLFFRRFCKNFFCFPPTFPSPFFLLLVSSLPPVPETSLGRAWSAPFCFQNDFGPPITIFFFHSLFAPHPERVVPSLFLLRAPIERAVPPFSFFKDFVFFAGKDRRVLERRPLLPPPPRKSDASFFRLSGSFHLFPPQLLFFCKKRTPS